MTILRQVQAFLRQSGMPHTKFGRLVANDPDLVRALRNGREPRAKMAERISDFLAQQTTTGAQS